jgi:hypothetical protein
MLQQQSLILLYFIPIIMAHYQMMFDAMFEMWGFKNASSTWANLQD